MKKWLLNVVVIGVLVSVSASAATWKDITYGVGTLMRVGTGHNLLIPLPAEARYTPFGYTVVPTYVAQFLVRVQPAFACKLATIEDGHALATSVVSSQHDLQPTSFAFSEPSRRRGREGWTNYYFNVNGGFGAPVQAISVAFQRGGAHARQCDFELAVTSDEVIQPQILPRGAAPQTAAALAAPAEKRERNLGEIKIELKTKAQ